MTIQAIPLSQLRVSPRNVRKTGADDVADLAASIMAHGLLQNLAVTAADDGFYEVEAGGRRLRALQSLAAAGSIGAETSVPCRVLNGEGHALEASIAENEIRRDMHPADQLAAFKALADAGHSVAEIAARFGVTALLVRQRLKLANVSPRLFALYREGKATLGQMQALAVVDDHRVQEAAWDAVKHDYERSEWNLRDRLTKAAVRVDDARVRFVGLDAYRAAGGAVNEDLFGNHSTVTDVSLLDRLVAERLADKVAEVEAEGWAWVEARVTFDYADEREYKTAGHPSARQPTAEEAARLAAIEGRITELQDSEEELSEEQEAELTALYEEQDAIEDRLEEYPAELMAASGAIVTPGRVYYARLKPGEKASAAKAADAPGRASASPGKAEKKPGDLPFAAVQRLQAEATGLIQAEVAESPRTALALLVFELARDAFYRDGYERSWVRISRQPSGRTCGPAREILDTCPGAKRLKAVEDAWRKKLPRAKGDLLSWVLAQEYVVLGRLLAYLVAREIDAVDVFAGDGRGNDVRALAAAASVDLSAGWKPTEEWLGTLPKGAIVEMVRDAAGKVGAAEVEKLKKANLPAAALAKLPAGWLPKQLRAPRSSKAAKAKKAAGKDAAAGADEADEP